MFYTYVFISLSTGKHYTGQTSNLKSRLENHNLGNSTYTKNRGPWKLVYFEEFKTRTEVILRETFFKSGKQTRVSQFHDKTLVIRGLSALGGSSRTAKSD